MSNDNLIQTLPSALEDAYRGMLTPGESVLVSIPGALGEGLVVTGSRLMVVRETDPYHGPSVFSHQLSRLRDVNIGSSPGGGMMGVAAEYPIANDEGTVYFPAELKPLFESAAEMVRSLLSGGPAVGKPAATTATPVTSSGECPSCGAAVCENDAFCSACGSQVREVCMICGGAMPVGSGFCPRCGSEAKPAATQCGACGAKANSSVLSYCPQCGTALTSKCASCGASLVPGWPKCRYCGRETGSPEGLAGQGQAMWRQMRRTEQPSQASTTTTEPQTESPAAKYNAKGAELFEQEQVQEAIEEFRRAIALDPNNASYHCNLAVAYDEVDQDDDARREYERALELSPTEPTALLYLGYLLNENNEAEQAAALWSRLMESAPGTPEAEEAAQNLRAQQEL